MNLYTVNYVLYCCWCRLGNMIMISYIYILTEYKEIKYKDWALMYYMKRKILFFVLKKLSFT